MSATAGRLLVGAHEPAGRQRALASALLLAVAAALELLRAGGTAEPAAAAAAESAGFAGLSRRELEVLGLLAAGARNRDIAERLVIGLRTAETHVRSILNKTGSANRTAAAAFALRHGLIAPDGPRMDALATDAGARSRGEACTVRCSCAQARAAPIGAKSSSSCSSCDMRSSFVSLTKRERP
ncbi:MAG TPA: LuxR C-terminal-related transcriptional regulator [Dehalococcoidia bacterium]|nr:LuxR C-terminal-related transcriptional regulator [Dehalococcoidia bacterium]